MIHFYKPNPKVTGSACSFYFNATDGSFFSQFIKQASWNDKTRTGSFAKDDPNKKASIKLSDIEIAGIIDALESDREFSGYHSSPKQVATFKISPYVDKASGVRRGFSYSLGREAKDDSTNKISFVIGFTFPEARRLRQYLEGLLCRYDAQKAAAYMEKPPYQAANQDRVKIKQHDLDSNGGLPENSSEDGDIW